MTTVKFSVPGRTIEYCMKIQETWKRETKKDETNAMYRDIGF